MDKLDDVRAVFEKLYKEQTVFIENTHGYDSQKLSLWAGFQLGWQASRESLEKERNEAIKHLILVFRQYANNDHLFMSAGEDACEFLEDLGYGIDTGRNLELTDKGKQLIKEYWE